MQKIRASIAAVLGFLFVFPLLTGCSDRRPKLTPDKPLTLVIWNYYHGAQKDAFDAAVREFNDTVGHESGIVAESVGIGGVDELAESVLAAARGEVDAGPMPDIFAAYADTALKIVSMDKAADLSSYMTEDELAEYYGSYIEEGRLGTDRLYVFPIAKATESLMLNKTDFDRFSSAMGADGISVSYADLATWEGVIRVAGLYHGYTEAQYDSGRFFLSIDTPANYVFVGARQLGGSVVDIGEDGPVMGANRELMRKLWDTYYIPTVTGYFGKVGRFGSDDVKTGDSICYIGSTSSAAYFPTEITSDGETRTLEMLALPMPVFEDGEKVAVSQGAGMVVTKASPEQEYAASVFLRWFTDSERNLDFTLLSSYLPVKTDILDVETLNGVLSTLQSGGSMKRNTAQALMTAARQLHEYKMYSPAVFERSADFRAVLPEGLITAADEGRGLYLAAIKSGMTADEALDTLSERAEQDFSTWMDTLFNYKF